MPQQRAVNRAFRGTGGSWTPATLLERDEAVESQIKRAPAGGVPGPVNRRRLVCGLAVLQLSGVKHLCEPKPGRDYSDLGRWSAALRTERFLSWLISLFLIECP